MFNCDASENKLEGKLLKGHRIGVIHRDSGECHTFTNQQTSKIQDAEAFAVLKTIEVAKNMGFKKIIVLTDNQTVAKRELDRKSKGFKYLQIADEKGVEYILEWIPRGQNVEADKVSRMKIKVRPRKEWI